MKTYYNIPMLDLQLFADGGSAGAGGGDGGTAQGAGVTAGAAGQQNSGVNTKAAPAAEGTAAAGQENVDPAAAFDALIKGQYKDQYNANVKKILDGRLSGLNKQLQGYQSGQAVFDILAEKYGLQPTDYAGIAKAAENDKSFVEQEALEKGKDPQDLLDLKRVQRENAAFRRQQEQQQRWQQEQIRIQQASRQEAEWKSQAEETKKVYPGLDLDTEIKNPQFAQLLRSGVPVRAAYEVVHMNEIMGGAMQYAASRTAQNVTNSVIAGAARPSENGTVSQSAATVKGDVLLLSKKDRADIIARVQKGEKIRL